MPTPTKLGLSSNMPSFTSGTRPGDNSKDRMNELFNDFKRLNIQDSNIAKNASSNRITHIDLSAANDENRKPVIVTSKSSGPNEKKPTSPFNLSSNLVESLELTHRHQDRTKVNSMKENALLYGNGSHSYENNTTVTLYVGDLDQKVTEKSLSSLFTKYESFLSAKLCYSPTTRLSLGYGYVNFSSDTDANRATEDLNYTLVANKEIRIMPYVKGKDKSFMSTNVFVSNLNTRELTLRLFYERFRHVGKILSCKLDVRKRQGFISFESKDTAEDFVKNYNTALIDGCNIHCSIHIPKSLRNFSSDYNGGEVSKSQSYSESLKSIKPSLVKSNTEESLTTIVHTPKRPENESHPKDEEFNQIYVKGLPITVTDDEIDAIFEPFGRIMEIYKETVANFKSTWCLVTFETHQSAVNAIENCHKVSYKGKNITCVKALKKAERQKILNSKPILQTPSPPKQLFNERESNNSFTQIHEKANKVNSTNLFVYNLPHSVNENFFKLFLRSYTLDGRVIKFSFQRGANENYIEFEKKSDAVTIHQKLNGVNLSGLIIQTSLIQLDDGVKNQESKKNPDKYQRKVIENNDMNNFQNKSKEHIHQQHTNFYPFDRSSNFHSNPASPPIAGYQAPSLSTYSSIHSLMNSIPSLSTYPSTESTSANPVVQNINGKPYRLIPVSNTPSLNEKSLNNLEQKRAHSLLNYHDLYSTSYDPKLSESLQKDLEKLALRQIDFLSYPSATRPNNLRKILNYMFMTFWDNSVDDVESFVKSVETHPEYVHLFKGRLIAAIKILGYER
ncbi:Polyadenylate-binding protein 1 [Wickerhamomyces ciferrii]|uniref:Polyadenylate-binding protein 1 n=1 Tax=Wickerhamomyces ciferrii (strain ATCC 14091 / BCRC 22168 / CBS 111 / JCM 3599 / NBRC 0793 / NRRL Y-1031 F-60-10) TaxID=1206466 RepID=K0KHQ2_WICCF|nr:Polyadenylate-binding protein 1 [Wickerhamomyces ciferrii]CCH42541.1 Polyadenylate-binding protein 1 [Wickerhamomyces ciferrii]